MTTELVLLGTAGGQMPDVGVPARATDFTGVTTAGTGGLRRLLGRRRPALIREW